MRIDRGFLGWGVFLIILGAVPLAVRGGYVAEDSVRRTWELWPLILVGIGLGLILQRTQLAIVGGLVVAVTFGLMGGSLLAVGVGGGFSACGIGVGTDAGTPFETRTGTLGSAASVELDLNCGDLTVAPAAGATWTVAGRDRDGNGPDITSTSDALRVRSPQHEGFGFGRAGQQWEVTMPADPAIDLSLSVNAGSARLDLTGAHVPNASVSVNAGDTHLNLSGAAAVGSLSASVNAGSLTLSLPAASLTGSVSANAGSVEMCIPAGVGMRFTGGENALGSNNFSSRGLVRSGQAWTSPGYDTATARIDMSTSANLGSITLNPEAGCD